MRSGFLRDLPVPSNFPNIVLALCHYDQLLGPYIVTVFIFTLATQLHHILHKKLNFNF